MAEPDALLVDELYCPGCGYNLRGVASGACPECGEGFDIESLRQSQIPWSARNGLGMFRAYWRTVWLVIRHNRRFCREVARPISYRDARRFQWMTIAHVYAAVLLVTAMLYGFYAVDALSDLQWLAPSLASMWPVAAAHLLMVLFVLLVTGVPSYWFHPRSVSVEMQNRGVALSYYTCAPLALLPITVLLLAVGIAMYTSLWVPVGQGRTIAEIAMAVGLLVIFFQLGYWICLPITWVRQAMLRGPLGATSLAVVWPASMLLLGVLVFVAVPGAIFGVVVVFLSLA